VVGEEQVGAVRTLGRAEGLGTQAHVAWGALGQRRGEDGDLDIVVVVYLGRGLARIAA
jgi:hypothetical protein